MFGLSSDPPSGHTTDPNPLAKRCAELQEEIVALSEIERQIVDELRWHGSTDPRALKDALRDDKLRVERLDSEVSGLEVELRENAAHQDEARSSRESLAAELGLINDRVAQLRESEDRLADELRWYDRIDPDALTSELREWESTADGLRLEIAALDEEAEEAAVRLREVESAIGAWFNLFNRFSKGQRELRRKQARLIAEAALMAGRRRSKATALGELRTRTAAAVDELRRHNKFDVGGQRDEARTMSKNIANDQEEATKVDGRFRQKYDEIVRLQEAHKFKSTRKRQAQKEAEEARTRVASVTRELDRYDAIDVPDRRRELEGVQHDLFRKKNELASADKRRRRIDEDLIPLLTQKQALEADMRRTRSQLDAAQGLDRDLSCASNGFEKKTLHDHCKLTLGASSPRTVIGQCEGELKRLADNHAKVERRLESIRKNAARKINKIVVDGNNMCYEGDNTFIGLSALVALLPLLSRDHPVVVVFDARIRHLLRSDDSQIRGRLGNHAKVHVVASKQSADETVLDLACADEFNYVISNDKFGEYIEKSVVRGGRVIRHEIVDGNVFIHDLQVSASFR